MSRAFNQATVVCENPNCPHFKERRVVSYPLIGSGIAGYLPAYCECGSGSEMRIVQED